MRAILVSKRREGGQVEMRQENEWEGRWKVGDGGKETILSSLSA